MIDALNTKQRIVLRHTLRPCWCASLDLPCAERYDEVGNDGVLSLTAPVGDHDAPTVRLRELCAGGY
jgi:hypothetical protein